ncbi:MAG: SDR family oxidoreductase [Nannocystis sp.]|uniref:SDR family NAD(P)-dependent oxidoreductase n=1 Tax=Nannocystis sp. TaxID=1962667 RepID=UPI002427C35C|nr:SDR family oxidoreductase [Nannocystis sp.]MBK9755542.1 SDR family oxidoreductase [Nannocystis sp.]
MSAPLIDLRDQVAIITGSSRGIGRAIAETMARAGARVVISSRKREACEAVAAGIRDAGGQAIVVPCNISERAQVEHLVDFTLQTWGRVDTLVCNAASNPYFGPITGVPDEVFTKIMHNNVLANLWLARLVAPGMRDRQGGSIILVSSIGGLRGDAFLGAYNISKAADMQLVRGLAVELGPANIRVNAIAPGLIKTDFAKALWENPELLARLERSTPLGRIGAPDDIAGLAAFLASSGAHFLTGQTIVVDGGLTTAAAW